MELVNRDFIERKLARVLGKDLRVELDTLMSHLGDPPLITNVPNDYWQNGWKVIAKDVEPVLVGVYLQQAEALMVEINIGVDWGLINTTASQWSRRHGEEVLKKLFKTTYEGVNQTIPKFYEQNWSIDDLAKELERWHSPVRAEMIAVTETTRAAVEGERAYVNQLFKESNIRMIPIWQTANDEIAMRCPICWPKHGKEITDGEYPPAHPRCRCGVVYRLPKAQP